MENTQLIWAGSNIKPPNKHWCKCDFGITIVGVIENNDKLGKATIVSMEENLLMLSSDDLDTIDVLRKVHDKLVSDPQWDPDILFYIHSNRDPRLVGKLRVMIEHIDLLLDERRKHV